MLRPRYALAAGVAAAAILFVIVIPQPEPLSAIVADSNAYILIVAVMLGLLAGAGLSFSFWLKRHIVIMSVLTGLCVVVAMWLERWLIIIPVLTHPRLVPFTTYQPTWIEIALTAASVALLVALMLVFFKFFPVVSIWEISEGRAKEAPAPSAAEAPKGKFLRSPLRRSASQ